MGPSARWQRSLSRPDSHGPRSRPCSPARRHPGSHSCHCRGRGACTAVRGRTAGTAHELWKLCIICGCFTAIRWPSWTKTLAEPWIAQEREQWEMQSCAVRRHSGQISSGVCLSLRCFYCCSSIEEVHNGCEYNIECGAFHDLSNSTWFTCLRGTRVLSIRQPSCFVSNICLEYGRSTRRRKAQLNLIMCYT